MKMVELKNVGTARLSIRQVRGFALDPGESTKVSPVTAEHPAVKRYIGRGLELVEPSKEEPKAPAPPTPEPLPEEEPTTEPTPESEPVTDSETESEPETETETEPESEPEDETAGKDLREEYISAPGITEFNVDGVLKAYPTFEALADAAKDDLSDLGVSKSYANRLKSWATEQLDS